MLTARHVHNNKSPVIGSERNPFPPTIPLSRMAEVFQGVDILKFSALVSIHWREPARSSRFFLATPAPDPAVSEEVVGV